MKLWPKLLAEFIGTSMLLAVVVGSGIMGSALAGGNNAMVLLANAMATAAALYVLIVLFSPISGAHFNPVVTLVMRLRSEITNGEAMSYAAVQMVAAVIGVVLAHVMFGLPSIQLGTHIRSGASIWISEGVATYGLLLTILVGGRYRPLAVPGLVAGYIFAAYWFTASTSFANPAVTFARSLTQTFAGIRPQDVMGFVLAQVIGALMGYATASVLCNLKPKFWLAAEENLPPPA